MFLNFEQPPKMRGVWLGTKMQQPGAFCPEDSHWELEDSVTALY